MAKILVEIPISGDAQSLMDEIEDKEKGWLVGSTTIIRVDEGYLKRDNDGKFLFRLKGVIDDEEAGK